MKPEFLGLAAGATDLPFPSPKPVFLPGEAVLGTDPIPLFLCPADFGTETSSSS